MLVFYKKADLQPFRVKPCLKEGRGNLFMNDSSGLCAAEMETVLDGYSFYHSYKSEKFEVFEKAEVNRRAI